MENDKIQRKEFCIENIPKEWIILSVGEVGKVVTGKTPPTNNLEYYGNDYLFIKIPDMTGSVYINKTNTKISEKGADYLGNARIPKNSIMVSCIATIGNVGITSEDSFTNQQINSLIPNENIADFKYLYYFFKVNKELLESLGGGGSVYTNISKSKFESMSVVLPEIKEQQKIAEILSSLDDKIELNRKINDNLEKIASSLFKRWFVDFEFPNKDGKPYKSNGGKMIDSELEKIPAGWRVGCFGDNQLTSFIKSGIDNFSNEKIYLDTSSVNNSFITDFSTKITINERPSRANMQPQIDSVWFAKMKNSRKLLFFDDYLAKVLGDCILSTGFAGIKTTPIALYYIWTFILSDEFDAKKNSLCQGTTMQAINNENISKIKYLIPSEEVLLKFNNFIKSFYQKAEILKFQNVKLSNICDSLLPKLMNGKIRVKI